MHAGRSVRLVCSLALYRLRESVDDSLHTGDVPGCQVTVERVNQVRMDRADRGVASIIPRVLLEPFSSCVCLADLRYGDGLRQLSSAPCAAERAEDASGLELRRWQSPPLLGFGTKRPVVLADHSRITRYIGSMRLGSFSVKLIHRVEDHRRGAMD
jgi:hypothetical protein